MEVLQSILDWMNANLGMAVGACALVLEFLFRLVKSEQPKSIAWMVRDVLGLVAEILGKAASFLDKVLPQRLKDPSQPPQ